MTPKYIKEALFELSSIVVPNLGTFTLEPIEAEFDEATQSILKRPGNQVAFVNDAETLASSTLATFMSERAFISQEAAETAIESFVTETLAFLENNERAPLEGLGYFTKSDLGQIVFHGDEILNDDPTFFGLQPEVSPAPPLMGATTNQPIVAAKPESSNLLWLILIPVILLSIVIIYFFVSPNAREKLTSLFPTSSEVTADDSLTNEVDDGEIAENDEDSSGDDDYVEEDEDDEDFVSDDEEVEPEPKITPVPKPSNSSEQSPTGTIIRQKTKRFYIGVGSYSSSANAQKALAEAQSKGYNTAKIIQVDGSKYRLSIGDYVQYDEAKSAGASAKSNYANQWIFKF